MAKVGYITKESGCYYCQGGQCYMCGEILPQGDDARIEQLEALLEEIRNGDPTVEDMPLWKEVMGK